MFCANVEFVPPPECPVFEPTWEEFKDTMSYIEKIRAIAEKSGICKIRPPAEWKPPFIIDMDNFRFTPRIQKLNELEAQSRVKILFLNDLAKFWELQGIQLKIPLVSRKYLDLYKLQKVVREEGGFVLVCNERKWARVASRMSYPPGKGISSTLRAHYERIIYPYDLFKAGITVDSTRKTEVIIKDEEAVKTTDLTSVLNEAEKTNTETKVTTPKSEAVYMTRSSRRMSQISHGASSVTSNTNQQQRKIFQIDIKPSSTNDREKKMISDADHYFCEVCTQGDMEKLLLLCDGCDDAYHTFCLLPPLNDVPVGDWRCPKCVAKECHKPVEAYGFEQAAREYTLESFGEMADHFKMKYFKMSPHLVPIETVEKEFWRLLSCLDEDVVVEYGADIHAAEFGSGFPTSKNQTVIDDHNKMYVESGWNLNNLPVLPSSVLQYISVDISGMKVPWCYVGMCFASFSWHTEDHWSYSVNYMHWGEPKTWYGVPGAKAELLEECMKKIAPELFEHSPDLLHQLTTILNPNILMAYGVPITRTDQHAGEFVITFPRSYHGGFNQGFNFAEAVNFCPADWLPYGRGSVEHYKELHRQCVFSNDELMCKMASVAETLDVSLAGLVYEDLAPVFEEDLRLRRGLLARGMTKLEKESFELLPDDERQCDYCKTTCFLSSVTCPCVPSRMVCLDHVDHLCRCRYHNRCLRYQLTEEELEVLLSRLKHRSEAKNRWKEKVKGVLSLASGDCLKPELSKLKALIQEAVQEKLQGNEQLKLLTSTVQEAEKLQTTIHQLTGSKVRTRQRGNGSSKYTCRLKAEDLRSLCRSVNELQCEIKEGDAIKSLMESIELFQEDCMKLFGAADLPRSDILEEMLLRSAEFPDVDLEEVVKLNQMLAQTKWLEKVKKALDDRGMLSMADTTLLIENGSTLEPHPSCEVSMAELQKLLTICQELEQSSSQWLKSWKETGSTVERSAVEKFLERASEVEAYLPGLESWKDYLRKADDWQKRALGVLSCSHLPHLDDIETLVNKGMQIPITIELRDQVEQKLTDARSWQLNIAETLRGGHRQTSILQRLLKRFLHQRSPPVGQENKNSQSCNMMEEFTVVMSECRRELEEVRKQNTEKLKESGTSACCHVCKNEMTKYQRKCPVCGVVCHAKCLVRKYSVGDVQKTTIACPSCSPSGRPKLETIESLVASYHALNICLPVGEALCCLLNRSSAWRTAAVDALHSEELMAALRMLDGLGEYDSTDSSSCGSLTDCSDVNLPDNGKAMPASSVTTGAAEHTYSSSLLRDNDEGCLLKSAVKKSNRQRLTPVVNLSQGSLTCLEKLMVEGWIIDVKMDVMADISHLLYSCRNGKKQKRKTLDLNNGSMVEVPSRKRKMEILAAESIPLQDDSTDDGMELKTPPGRTSSTGADGAVSKIFKAGSKKIQKRKRPEQKFASSEAASESESDTDEICSADKCQRPKAKKVNWVQCDECQLWFHLLCIGQTMNQIAREKDYICPKCFVKTISSSGSQSGMFGSHCQTSPPSDSSQIEHILPSSSLAAIFLGTTTLVQSVTHLE